MDLYQIRYFLAIAETGSFTKAAERLFVSQPSLSTGIKKLEQELGVMLLERGGRRVLLTPAGQFFLEKAQTIFKEYQATLHELKGFHKRPTLKLGTLHTMRGCNLARLIAAFCTKHPNVLIELYNGQVEELQDWLEQGEIDLAITSAIAAVNQHQDTKTSALLFQQKLLLAVPVGHAFAQRGSVRLADLDQQPYIQRIHCEVGRECPHLFEAQGIRPHLVYAADKEEWVISLIQAGLGISIMPLWQDLANVIYIPVLDLNLSREVTLKWRYQQGSDVVDWFRVFALSHDWQV